MSDHPTELRLQAYFDDELPPEERGRMAAHLAQCPQCAQLIAQWQGVRLLLRRTLPSAECFGNEGEFWGRLAVRLSEPRPAVWPWITYLPPLLFGALGSALGLAAGLIVSLYRLARLGLLPALSPDRAQSLAASLAQSLWRYTALSWFGSEARATEALQQILARLSGDAIQIGLTAFILVALAAGWLAVATLYASWLVCWRGSRVAGAKRR
jgi:anti-sigma factor RsiW